MGSLTRRQVTSGSMILGISSALGLAPQTAYSQGICDICKLSRFHPARFIGGLVFDFVVKEVAYPIVRDLIFSGTSSSYTFISDLTHLPANEYTKGGYIVAGVADYEVYKEGRINLLTARLAQSDRVAMIADYMTSREIKIKSAYTSMSYPIRKDSLLDDLMSAEYFTSDRVKISSDHYVNELIRITGSTAFDGWTS